MAATLVIADDLWRGLREHLLAGRDERLAFVLARDAGERLLARELIAIPDAALDVQAADRLSLHPDMQIEVMNAAARSGLSIVEAHSHPSARGAVDFSLTDRLGQEETVAYLSDVLPGRSYGALVLGRDAVRGTVWRGSDRKALASISVVGDTLEGWPADGRAMDALGVGHASRERHDRQARAFGKAGHARIAGTRLAIVGLGGIGSLVAMQLAHLGARDLVLIDHDLVEETNLNRLAGAGARDIGRAKVAVVADYARKVDPAIRVLPLQMNIRDPQAMRVATGADVLFGCVDTDSGRLILNRLALAYLLPYIDCGVSIKATAGVIEEAGGRVVVWTPGRPCLLCCRAINTAVASAELEPTELQEDRRRHGYVLGADIPDPSVVSLNGVIASMAVTEFLALVTGFRASRHYRVHDMLEQRVVCRCEQRQAGCVACASEGTGDEAGLERYARRGLPADSPLPGRTV